MPIVGLTDQQAAFPVIGVLRKGEEKKGNAPGKDLTYFRFTTDDEDAKCHFEDAYPDQEALRRINVLLPHKTADENMDAWKEEWVAGGLVHRCNGKKTVLIRTDNGDYSTEPQDCPGGCKQVGRLSVIIPELGRLATVTVLTTSIHDIINLTKQLRSYEAINGDLRGIPFIIVRRPKLISTPSGKNGNRARRKKWLLSIESQPTWTRLQLNAMRQAALPEAVDIIDGEYSTPGIVDLPAIASPVEEDALPEPPPTFANIDDLLYQLNQDFGLSEADAKALLKDNGFETFSPGKSGEMYQSIEATFDIAHQEADAILEQPALVEQENGGAAYSENS
jgi:hypothetical protein